LLSRGDPSANRSRLLLFASEITEIDCRLEDKRAVVEVLSDGGLEPDRSGLTGCYVADEHLAPAPAQLYSITGNGGTDRGLAGCLFAHVRYQERRSPLAADWCISGRDPDFELGALFDGQGHVRSSIDAGFGRPPGPNRFCMLIIEGNVHLVVPCFDILGNYHIKWDRPWRPRTQITDSDFASLDPERRVSRVC
jgi:hypothetical protein